MTAGPERRNAEIAGFDIDLLGMLSARIGLGSAARMTLRLLESHAEWSVAATDVVMPSVPRVTLDTRVPLLGLATPAAVSIWHLNPDQMLDGVLSWRPRVARDMAERSLLATVPYWELETLPPGWAEYLASLDVVLAPSGFIADAVRSSIECHEGAGQVWAFPQAVRPPEGVRSDRPRWFGARASTCVFMTSFDLLSEPERKNPMGVIEAFDRAARSRDDMTLVLKVGHRDAASVTAREYARLEERERRDPRIMIVTERLSDADMWSLLASADVYVSLHRAEGLGLGLMESMALGTPVIGTGWSGNLDFMTSTNSILVPYQLVPTSAELNSVYRAMAGVARWAEPDIDRAAEAMRALADDPSAARRLGQAALSTSRERWARYNRADPVGRLLEFARAGETASPERRHRIARLVRIARRRRLTAERMARRLKVDAVRALRAARLKPPAPADEIPYGPWPLATRPYEG